MRFLLVALFLLVAHSASAHEFWIEPEQYTVEAGGQIRADLKNGEAFEGNTLSYVPTRFTRFELIVGTEVTPVEGRPGDRPALNLAAPAEGLAILVHETTQSRITYSEWERFTAFVDHKALTGTLQAHAARGLPEADFVESFTRFCKALVSVGHGEGTDGVTGMLTEIVAGANPYTDDLSAGMPLRVIFDGQPRVGAQVELFEKSTDGTVEITYYLTDADGWVAVPVKPGHTYLADAVVIRPIGTTVEAGPVWETLWAAMTFAVPD